MVHGRRAGQETRPYEMAVKHSVVENWRAATRGRPYNISGETQQNRRTGEPGPAPTAISGPFIEYGATEVVLWLRRSPVLRVTEIAP